MRPTGMQVPDCQWPSGKTHVPPCCLAGRLLMLRFVCTVSLSTSEGFCHCAPGPDDIHMPSSVASTRSPRPPPPPETSLQSVPAVAQVPVVTERLVAAETQHKDLLLQTLLLPHFLANTAGAKAFHWLPVTSRTVTYFVPVASGLFDRSSGDNTKNGVLKQAVSTKLLFKLLGRRRRRAGQASIYTGTGRIDPA